MNASRFDTTRQHLPAKLQQIWSKLILHDCLRLCKRRITADSKSWTTFSMRRMWYVQFRQKYIIKIPYPRPAIAWPFDPKRSLQCQHEHSPWLQIVDWLLIRWLILHNYSDGRIRKVRLGHQLAIYYKVYQKSLPGLSLELFCPFSVVWLPVCSQSFYEFINSLQLKIEIKIKDKRWKCWCGQGLFF